MNAVGIDVSKKKSTVTIRQPGDKVILAPRDYRHTQTSINELIALINGLEGETKVCMEHTGRYYEPVASWLFRAGIFVSAVNPKLIRDFGNDSLHSPKTDKADSKKIARYALDRWAKLRQYSPMDELRNQLKTMNRQFSFYTDQKTAMKNNLIALLDQTFPGANAFFDSPARSDGSQKWVDFAFAANLSVPSPNTTEIGAVERAITSVLAKRKKFTVTHLTSSPCFPKTTTPRC